MSSSAIPNDKMAALIAIRDLFPGLDAKTQCNRVLDFLGRGYMLSTFEGSRYLDVYHLPARIMELRNATTLNFQVERSGQQMPITVTLEP